MNSKFLEIKELFANGTLFFDGIYFTSKGLSDKQFESLFPPAEYKSFKFTDQTGTVDVSEVDFIFKDYHDLIQHVEISDDYERFQNEIILITKGLVQIGGFAEYYKNWMDIFDKISDHQYRISPLCLAKTYIFIEKKSANASTLLTIDIDQVSEERIEKLVESISNPISLLDSCLQEDAHQGEKISTLKTSIVNIVEERQLSFIDLLGLGEELFNTFHTNYETYLRSFSFEEFIKDLEDDVGDFINKVEEQIQGFYVQALAVPGAVILASALRGAEKSISLALLFSTVLALIIVFSSLKSKTKFIVRITENTLTKLNIYQRRTSDIENSFAKQTISEKIKVAVDSVNITSKDSKLEIEKLRDIIIALIAFYVISSVLLGSF
jgi:hypothetical protein